MYSQDQINTATQIAQFVIENGRVSDEIGWNESLFGEVEFECMERDLDDCEEIARIAVREFGK